MYFTWDPKKARLNHRKHGVRFDEAAECFADPLAKILIDAAFPSRLILVGESSTRRLLFVVYVEIEHEVVRIVSARKATSFERSQYEEES